MEFGAFLNQYYYPGSGFGLDDILEQAERMAAVGFDSATLGERHVHREGVVEPITGLTALATRTDLTIGAAALLPALYDPLRLAEQAAMIDELATGRFHLGAALGYRERELAAFGVDMDERVGRLVESLHLIDQFLTADEPVTHHGEFYDYEEALISPQPPAGLPVWIGGHADEAIRRAAYRGDGWIASASSTTADLERQIEVYESARKEFDRGPGEIVLMRDCYIADSAAAAREAVEPHLLDLYEWYDRWGQTYMAERDVGVDWDALEEKFVIGTPSEAIADFETYADLGVDHVLLRFQFPGQSQESALACIERLGEEVLPAFE
ncbi:MAG: LLM class flavin-dependent oxidoreductase [Salinirussus sp.]